MNTPEFKTLPLASNSTVSWIHIGDTHLTRAGKQNADDLGRIVDEINALYADGGVDFVFVPGDIADDGSVAAYQVFRSHPDRLKLPWCGIVGDHDVHEKSFDNFTRFISQSLYGSFSIGHYRFFRLNAFSEPRPDAFILDTEQLQWLERELKHCESNASKAILLLHCYPSDLKKGGAELAAMLRRYPVLLVDMGHTHYNEISNDGRVLYSTTRSTGQIEEGPVGYSLTTVDGDIVSWHFVPLGGSGLAAITQPADERLITERIGSPEATTLSVHAKIWPRSLVHSVDAIVDEQEISMNSDDGVLWQCQIDRHELAEGSHGVAVTATFASGGALTSTIRIDVGTRREKKYSAVDQENAIGAWPSHGLLGTQLGPNKNGKKW